MCTATYQDQDSNIQKFRKTMLVAAVCVAPLTYWWANWQLTAHSICRVVACQILGRTCVCRMPSATFCYWITSNCFSCVQVRRQSCLERSELYIHFYDVVSGATDEITIGKTIIGYRNCVVFIRLKAFIFSRKMPFDWLARVSRGAQCRQTRDTWGDSSCNTWESQSGKSDL